MATSEKEKSGIDLPGSEPNVYDVSVIIPARNEESSLPPVLRSVLRVREATNERWEIIVVDDNSRDRTAEVARILDVSVIANRLPRGKGSALRTGFEASRGSYLVMMDADGSHRADDIPVLLEAARRERAMVIGSRIYGGSQEYTRVRAFGNVILTWWFGFLHGRYLSDALNGFKVFPREIFDNFKYSATGFEIEIELLVKALKLGRPIVEVPSNELARSGGKSKSRVIIDGLRFFIRTVTELF